ncbi:MAG: VOC family protein [Maribacter sp.]|uniref:VOC family protein n=1 Tax=Maribacter sp. TaxID=1897614 RepID=UPI0032985919
MKKTVVHFEIGCGDIDKTSDSYSAVFDWKLNNHGNSSIIDTRNEDALSGHINKLGPNDPQNYVTVYIETDALHSDLEAIESNGGEIFVKPIKLPDGREFAWLKDVAGNLIGLITPTPKQMEFE